MNHSEFLIEIESLLFQNQCDLSKSFKNVKVWSKNEKNSASKTVIIEADLILPNELKKFKNFSKIIGKVSVNEDHKYDKKYYRQLSIKKGDINNSLIVEHQIYNFLQTFIVHRVCPHIVGYLGSFSCENLSFSDKVLKTIDSNVKPYSYNMLLVTKSTGKQLIDMIYKASISSIMKIFFQIIYTLLCFSNVKLSHNDLHPGNIFIEYSLRPKIINYIIHDKIYILETNYIVKIYDFDRASIAKHNIEKNLYLTFWEFDKSSMIYPFYKNKDLFHLISTLYGERSDLDDFFDIFMKDKSKLEKIKNFNSRFWVPIKLVNEKKVNMDYYKEAIKYGDYWLFDKIDMFNIELVYGIYAKRVHKSYMRTDRRQYEYIHADEDSDKIIYPLEKCLDILGKKLCDKKKIKIENFNENKHLDKPNYYYLNSEIKQTEWYPLCGSIQNIKPILEYPNINELSINKQILALCNIFILKEHYNYDYIEKWKELIKKTTEKENKIPFVWIQSACGLLACPYWHSFGETTKREIIYIISSRMSSEPIILENLINIIWGLFDYKLPIKMPFF